MTTGVVAATFGPLRQYQRTHHSINLVYHVRVAMKQIVVIAGLTTCVLIAQSTRAEDGLAAHWKLRSDARDSAGGEHHAVNHGVQFTDDGAVFNGVDAWLEVPHSESLQFGTDDFSIAARIHTEHELDDVPGDVITGYDAATRTGFTISLMSYAGVTNAQSNWRNVLFGIDAGHIDNEWTDCGRPGTNQQVKSLAVYDGQLYAATWEPDGDNAGHVHRYAGNGQWIDCGSPDKANAIAALAVYDGRLYAGSEMYSGGGSSLPLSPNENYGGTVFRYEGESNWTNVGKIADVRSVSGLAVFKGQLYAGTGTTGAWRDTPRTRGMYRYDGDGKWTSCGCPGLRIVHLSVHNGNLYGLSYDDGGFFRYDGGTNWTQLGPLPDTTQVYGTAIYEGKLFAGTWPTGSVFRLDGPQQWTHAGRLGEEKEVMAMSVYNGQMYAGTLPFADVYRYDGGTRWATTGRLDHTPDVRYRRAWSMAVFQGKLFCGTLPSGHVLSLEAGRSVTYDHALPAGWHHLAAVRSNDTLHLYLDGKPVARSTRFDPATYNLNTQGPLKIGFGQHDYFN
ncbi:MAG: hypothetical protein KDA89_23380, partial [Planctomycetaceae bacterium]|nr:hypothetical protein [Planctomycetaceae bacterium]